MTNQEWSQAIQSIVQQVKDGLITDTEALAKLIELSHEGDQD